MFKLTYEGNSKNFVDVPTISQVQDFTGNLISFGLYESLLKNKTTGGFSGTYYLVEIPTIEQLNASWNDFLKIGVYQDQRFGQWFYNQFDYEVDNSYNIERPYQAYQVLYNDLLTTLDGVLGDLK